MTRKMKLALCGVSGLILAGLAGVAIAQQSTAPAPSPTPSTIPAIVVAAYADASIGEQHDGKIGFRIPPSPELRREVDALNIKRQAAYTKLAQEKVAQQKGATPREVALATACTVLATRVGVGRAYLLPDGVWRIRKAGETIELPDYCGT